MKNYQFFQNKNCDFFPCHPVNDKKTFNCLFCYCLLYALKNRCEGNFNILGDGVKDCSQCLIVHGSKGYDYVMSKMEEVMELGKIVQSESKSE